MLTAAQYSFIVQNRDLKHYSFPFRLGYLFKKSTIFLYTWTVCTFFNYLVSNTRMRYSRDQKIGTKGKAKLIVSFSFRTSINIRKSRVVNGKANILG